jgi:uncharacterized cupredoxin-like copper-binding protein
MAANPKRPIPRRVAIALAVVLASGVLAACGSSSNSSKTTTQSASPTTTPKQTKTTAATSSGGGGATTALSLTASEQGGLSFNAKTLSAKAGTVTIKMTNPSGDSLPHGIAIEGNGVDKDGKTVQPGGTSTVTVKLKPGTYTFYCPVDGHRSAGMKGTLVVH